MAGYIDRNLVPGERVLYRTRLHWALMFRRSIGYWLLVLAALGIGAWLRLPPTPGWFLWLVLALGGVATLSSLVTYAHYTAADFGLTNQRVILKEGLVRNHVLELFLAKVEAIAVDQTLAGRLFGFGSVTVTGTGGTRERFDCIDRPLEFQRRVEAQIAIASQSGPRAGSG